jgi:hypothetical protein
MDIRSGDVSSMTFKTSIRVDIGEISLDGQMLIVLMELDGKRNAGLIAQAVGMSMTEVSAIISKLSRRHLIQVAEQDQPMLGQDFFDFLIDQLSLVVGPISQLLLEDAAKEIGQGSASIPKMRAAELIDLIARQIPEEKQRLLFIQSMMQKLKGI